MSSLKKINVYFLLLLSVGVFSQQQITLDECYELVIKNYPLAKKTALLEKQNLLDLAVIDTEKLPQINLSAQATYQSDVIGVPIATLTPPNKDQYRATISATQLIYADGIIAAKKAVKKANLQTQKKQVEVNLHQLKKRVNQLFFSIILLQEKHNLLISKNNVLNTKLKEVISGIKNGVLLPTSDKVIESELLKIQQQLTEIDTNSTILIDNLATLIGQKIDFTKLFKQPSLTTSLGGNITRPELDLFRLKKEEIEASKEVLSKKKSPKILGFVNSGYGNPGLNMLDNSFQGYYTVGVKLNWNIFDWKANKKQQESIAINKDIINNQKEIFTLNTKIVLKNLEAEISKITTFITTDKKIIVLQKEVLKSVESQLKNSVITASGYITELSNLFEAKNTLLTHFIQLNLAKANYNTTQGK